MLSNRELYLEWCNNWQSLEDFSRHFSMHINFARQLIISEELQRSSILNRLNLTQRVLVSARIINVTKEVTKASFKTH